MQTNYFQFLYHKILTSSKRNENVYTPNFKQKESKKKGPSITYKVKFNFIKNLRFHNFNIHINFHQN